MYCPPLQQFLFCALKLFLIEVRGADFHTAPEEVRRLINLWVEVQTHGMGNTFIGYSLL